jgi:general secretion pathway protein G
MEKKERWQEGASRCAKGFTLLELLVVLVILGLLAAIATPQVMKYLGQAKTDTALLQIENLGVTLDLYKLDNGDYPSEQQGLDALLKQPPNAPNWNGPYTRKDQSLIDPWGKKYFYKYPGEHGEFDLYSLGSDHKVGGGGEKRDVSNWQ